MRSAASRARAGPLMKATSAGTESRHWPSTISSVELAGAGLAKDLAGRGETEDDARLLLDDPRPGARGLGHGRVRGHVAVAEVLGEGAGDQRGEVGVGGRCHPPTIFGPDRHRGPRAGQRAKTASVAVKPCRKLRPPTGPISPAQKKPPTGAASASSTASASWSATPNMPRPRPLQVNISAPAAPPSPIAPACTASASRRSASAEIAVADVQAHGLTDPHLLADRDGAGLAIGADDRPDEEVAALVLGPVLVDHDSDQHPLGDLAALGFGQIRDHLADPLQGRPEGELGDHVALGRRDRHLLTDRRRSLRDARRHLDPAQEAADGTRAGVGDLAVDDQRRRAPAPPRLRARRAPASRAARR